jgi:lipopolysaccharide transport system permease protein
MTPQPAGLSGWLRSLVAHRDLLGRLTAREVSQRFRGSQLGLVWAVLTPLLTAAVFTLVFTGVFPTRWPNTGGSPLDFMLILLVGLAVHGVLAEALGRAPLLVVQNASYVTKVVFPLEVLPLVATLAALVNGGITLAIMLLGHLALKGLPPATALLLPLILLPYLLFVVAAVTAAAAAGVFIRDLQLAVAPLLTLMMFLSPMFFPMEAVPGAWRPVFWANPITLIMEEARAVLFFGRWPRLGLLALYGAFALGLLAVANWMFQRLRRGFADVL